MISDMQAPAISRTAQYKKVTKPLLERKRRARINRCLDELKDLMMDALEAEGENISKLEKADILELTVRHLHRLQRPRNAVEDAQRYQAGFGQCAAEACQFLLSIPGVDTRLGHSLIKHLGACVGNGPLSIQVPNLNRLCYSPPVSPLTPIIKNNTDATPTQNNVLSSTPSVQDLSKPMTGLLMQVPVTNMSEKRENRRDSEKIGSPYKENPRELIQSKVDNYSKQKYGMIVENSIRNVSDDKHAKRVLRTAILERRKMAIQNPEKCVFKRPSTVGPVVSDFNYEKNSEYSMNEDDDEEIDIENIEDGDNMWRPW